MAQVILLTSIVWAVIAACDSEKQFRPDYKFNPDVNGWFKLHTVPAKWEDARLRCFFEGAVLASPINRKVAVGIRDIVFPEPIYTGIHATISSGDYYSVEGEPLADTPVMWSAFQSAKENCLVYYANGVLTNVDCSQMLPYMCYKKNTQDMEQTECGTVDTEYKLDHRTGSCYKFHRAGMPWSRAMMACSAEGGYLAIINSDVEAEVIRDLFAKNPASSITAIFKDGARIGIYDWAESGLWGTIHGQILEEAGYAKWGEGEPNNIIINGKGEYCGSVFRQGRLDDTCCDCNMAFICEKDPKIFYNMS